MNIQKGRYYIWFLPITFIYLPVIFFDLYVNGFINTQWFQIIWFLGYGVYLYRNSERKSTVVKLGLFLFMLLLPMSWSITGDGMRLARSCEDGTKVFMTRGQSSGGLSVLGMPSRVFYSQSEIVVFVSKGTGGCAPRNQLAE